MRPFICKFQVKVNLDSHDLMAPGSWCVEKVFVKKKESASQPDGRMWLIDVAAWLCTPNLDQQPCWSRTSIQRQPAAARDAARLSQESIEIVTMKGQPVKSYRIDIITGSQRGAGTDSRIMLDIAGKNYSTKLNMSWKKSATHRTPFQGKTKN